MRKGFVFILVGLVYVVIAMAASWANSSQTLDRTLEVIGITPGTDAGHSLNSIEIPGHDNTTIDDNAKSETLQSDDNELLAYFIPVPPPGSGSGTRPQEIINS